MISPCRLVLRFATVLWVVLLPFTMALGAEAVPLLPAVSATAGSSSTTSLFTNEEWQGAPTLPTTQGIAAPAVMSILVSVLAVAGLAVGLGWAVRRFGLRRFIPGAGGHLDVVDRLSLGRRRSILLVRCGDRLFLVGDSEQGLHGCGEMPVEGVPALVFQRQLRAAQQGEKAP